MAERTYRGLLGEKLGMTQVWDTEHGNRLVPVTVVKAGPCVVTQVRTPDVDGYNAVQLAFGSVDPRRVTRPLAGHFRKAGIPPRRHVVELRTDDASTYAVGQEVTVELFERGNKVDVVATSRGKGFAGGMKRHGFHGLGAGHGVERKHRSPGSIGACATPSRVFKGTRMAGRLGGVRTTTLSLTVHGVDTERGYLLIEGAVPGPKGALVLVRSAAKHPLERGSNADPAAGRIARTVEPIIEPPPEPIVEPAPEPPSEPVAAPAEPVAETAVTTEAQAPEAATEAAAEPTTEEGQ